MNGGDTAQPDIAERDALTKLPNALDAAIENVFDRLMTLDGAMGALADAEVGMAHALSHAEALADAYRDRPEYAEALCHLDELCEVACRSLATLARERPLANDVDDGPPARGSSPQLVAPPRARRDTLADCPHALREAPGDARNAVPEAAHAENSVAPAPEKPLLPSSAPAPRSDAAYMDYPTPAPVRDEDGIP
jgi:hypothetical protein